MARSKKACLVFFDEIDAIGGARFDDGAGGDNEVQRTMLEIVNQLDGFDSRGNIKVGLLPPEEEEGRCPACLQLGHCQRGHAQPRWRVRVSQAGGFKVRGHKGGCFHKSYEVSTQ